MYQQKQKTMEIKIDYALWNKEHTKIMFFKTLKISFKNFLLSEKYFHSVLIIKLFNKVRQKKLPKIRLLIRQHQIYQPSQGCLLDKIHPGEAQRTNNNPSFLFSTLQVK